MAFVKIVIFLETKIFTSYFANISVVFLMWENTNIKSYETAEIR